MLCGTEARDSGAEKGFGTTTAHEGKNRTIKEMIRHDRKATHSTFYSLKHEILQKGVGGEDDVVEGTLVLQIQRQRQHPQGRWWLH